MGVGGGRYVGQIHGSQVEWTDSSRCIVDTENHNFSIECEYLKRINGFMEDVLKKSAKENTHLQLYKKDTKGEVVLMSMRTFMRTLVKE